MDTDTRVDQSAAGVQNPLRRSSPRLAPTQKIGRPPPKRDIELVDTYNLRDLGGYSTDDGRQVRWRRLFRGAGLQRLSGADLDVVGQLGLVTAIDLRTDDELAASGGFPTGLVSAAFHHLPLIERVWDLGPLDADAPAADFLLARYQEMLTEGAGTIAAVVKIISDPQHLPAVFYCAAGKDRTGVLAGVILDAIGVRTHAIVADYHLSKQRVERIRARALASAGPAAASMVAQPSVFMQAPAEAMALLLDWIRRAHGGSAAYLETIGVAPAIVGALAEGLLEPVS
jgi:protein-tyrosine phosphatase